MSAGDPKLRFVRFDRDLTHVLLFDADPAVSFERVDELIDLHDRALQFHVDRAVILIPDPAGQAQVMGDRLSALAETDALDAAFEGDVVADGIGCHGYAPFWLVGIL